MPFSAKGIGGEMTTFQATSCVADAFEQADEAARREGYQIRVASAFRSWYAQAQTYCHYVETDGEEVAKARVAPPDTSRHVTGNALDVFLYRGNERLTNLRMRAPETALTEDEMRLARYMSAGGFFPLASEPFHFTHN